MRISFTAAIAAAALVVACSSDDSGSTTSSSSSSSSSSSGGTTASGESVDTSAAQICVDTINKFRATQNLPALARWTDIEACSDSEAKSDGTSNTPHGAFPKCGESSQNECPGWPGPADQMIPKCLEAMWSQGPGEGHHDNMASTKWKKVACGFYTTPAGKVWSVQNFQ